MLYMGLMLSSKEISFSMFCKNSIFNKVSLLQWPELMQEFLMSYSAFTWAKLGQGSLEMNFYQRRLIRDKYRNLTSC